MIVAECKTKGQECDVASFQAVFEFKGIDQVNNGFARKPYDKIV